MWAGGECRKGIVRTLISYNHCAGDIILLEISCWGYNTTLCTDIIEPLGQLNHVSCIMYNKGICICGSECHTTLRAMDDGYHASRIIIQPWISWKSVLIWYNHSAEDIIQPGISTYHTTLRPYPLMNPLHSYILYQRNITKALGILWTCSHPSRDFSHPSATSGTRTWGKQETMLIGTYFLLKNCRYASSLSAL